MLRLPLLAGVFLLLLSMQSACAIEVALIGDTSKRSVMQKLADEEKAKITRSAGISRVVLRNNTVLTVTDSTEDPVAIANQLLTADLALLVVDATQGPLPTVREQLIIARQARIPLVAVYFSKTRALRAASPKEAPELLALESAEMNELLGKYEMRGAKSAILFDWDVSGFHPSPYARGSSDLHRFLSSTQARRPPPPALRPVSEFIGVNYLLTNQEANGRGATLAENSALDVWIEGAATSATVKSSASHKPGAVGEFVLRLSSPLKAEEGSRLLLVQSGAVVGLGVVKKIVK